MNMRVKLSNNGDEHSNSDDIQPYSNLAGLSRLLAKLVNRPVVVVYGLLLPVSFVAWIWLVLAARSMASNNDWLAYLVIVTTPSSISATVTIETMGAMFFMWLIMVTAMMLPTASLMLRTYADIADTAVGKNEIVVPVTVLAGGYLTIWLGFAILATLLQAAIIAAGHAGGSPASISGLIGGGVLILAGIYQFSSLKYACLIKCRNPFTVIFGQWSDRRGDVYRLGLQQGWFCLGCCWALMLTMLSVGTMNLLWMAFLTIFTLLEKTVTGYTFTRIFGTVLLAWGAYLVLNSTNLSFS